MNTVQKFIDQDTQVFTNRDSIQRTRRMCIYWTQKYTRISSCELNKDKHCRPAICSQFEMKPKLYPKTE